MDREQLTSWEKVVMDGVIAILNATGVKWESARLQVRLEATVEPIFVDITLTDGANTPDLVAMEGKYWMLANKKQTNENRLRILQRLEKQEMSHKITISEEDRQLILLSLALCSIQRPGFDPALQSIAGMLWGLEMYQEFKKCNSISEFAAKAFKDGGTGLLPESLTALQKTVLKDKHRKDHESVDGTNCTDLTMLWCEKFGHAKDHKQFGFCEVSDEVAEEIAVEDCGCST